MSWTLGQVKARVRNLLDDPQGSYLTDSFLVPLICEVYDDANSQLASTQSSWDITVVEVPGYSATHAEPGALPNRGRPARGPDRPAAAHRLEAGGRRPQLLPVGAKLRGPS